jgi:hypothetical protein
MDNVAGADRKDQASTKHTDYAKRTETLQRSLQELQEQRALTEKATARVGLNDAGPQLVVDGL